MWVKWEEKEGESVSQWVSPWLKGKPKIENGLLQPMIAKTKTNHNHINETKQNRTEQIDINIYIYIYI